MSIERRVDLNLSMPDFGAGNLQSGRGDRSPGRDAPDAEAEQRFAAALAAQDMPDEKKNATAAAPPPFVLFQQGIKAINPGVREAIPHQAELSENLNSEVERLMVSDGSSGNRQVRLELKNDLFPGVNVAIQELEGRLQVNFVCSDEGSRQKLNRALPDLADTPAQRLGRDVLMRVQTDDEDDPCLLEALSNG